MRVVISISDPWDLGEALKWPLLTGELLRLEEDGSGGQTLVKLDDAINYRGSIWRYIVASPRHEGVDIAALRAGKKICGAFTAIRDQQAESGSPPPTQDWRGGLASLGTSDHPRDARADPSGA